jgi:hypothetical protein
LTVATSNDHEDVIASLTVYPAGAPQLAWKNPTLAIADPLSNATVSTSGKIDLNATITNPQNEGVVVGWFVTDGDVDNRRASSTQWSLTHTGTETVAATVHGVTSRGFAMQIINVTAGP